MSVPRFRYKECEKSGSSDASSGEEKRPVGELSVRFEAVGAEESREVLADEIEQLGAWIDGYRAALKVGDNRKRMLAIGEEIYDWLNRDQGWMDRVLSRAFKPPLIVEFEVSHSPKEDELRFCEVPWELLAREGRYLAGDPYVLFNPVRRIGALGRQQEPSPNRLNAVFMAAAPVGADELAYELEEAAILEATGNIGMDLTVEESGSPELLGECMTVQAPLDVLHVSCHGNNDPEPVLLLEDQEGKKLPTGTGRLAESLGDHVPKLLFVSACLTSDPDQLLNSFSTDMIRRGAPAVLGWGGSVQDREATRYAERLYGFLAKKNSLESSVARARGCAVGC